MELRTNLVYSEPLYGGQPKGILTLGENKVIQLENGKKIELLPYILDYHYTRGISHNDPRIKRSNEKAIPFLAEAYIEHYNNAGIGEHWTKEEAEEMLRWHCGQSLGRLFFVKWAQDLETGEEFPVGFYSAYTKPYQGGRMLWDTELFVLPEYRKYGIGTELIKAVFITAAEMGINLFESLTYEDENGHPFAMWKKFGAESSDLIHIFGEIPQMLSAIEAHEEKKSHK